MTGKIKPFDIVVFAEFDLSVRVDVHKFRRIAETVFQLSGFIAEHNRLLKDGDVSALVTNWGIMMISTKNGEINNATLNTLFEPDRGTWGHFCLNEVSWNRFHGAKLTTWKPGGARK